jgi:hypothetical protein
VLGGSQIGTTHFKGGEADNLEMTYQTICVYVVNIILSLQSDCKGFWWEK